MDASSVSDEAIIDSLRRARGSLNAIELAELLGSRLPDGIDLSALIGYFNRAFPDIPLRSLLDAGAWHRVGGGEMTDADFEAHFNEWLGNLP